MNILPLKITKQKSDFTASHLYKGPLAALKGVKRSALYLVRGARAGVQHAAAGITNITSPEQHVGVVEGKVEVFGKKIWQRICEEEKRTKEEKKKKDKELKATAKEIKRQNAEKATGKTLLCSVCDKAFPCKDHPSALAKDETGKIIPDADDEGFVKKF